MLQSRSTSQTRQQPLHGLFECRVTFEPSPQTMLAFCCQCRSRHWRCPYTVYTEWSECAFWCAFQMSVRRMNARTVMVAGTTGLCCQRPTRWVEEKYASWGLKPLGAWIATRKIARCCEAVPSHTFQVFLFPMLQTAAGGSSARRHQKAPTIQSVACGGHPRQASLHVAPGTKTFWPDGRGVVRLRL